MNAEPLIILPPKAAARLRAKFAEGPFTGRLEIEIRDGIVTTVRITSFYRAEKESKEERPR